jgi:hypothetical protein
MIIINTNTPILYTQFNILIVVEIFGEVETCGPAMLKNRLKIIYTKI